MEGGCESHGGTVWEPPPPARSTEAQILQGIHRPRKHSTMDPKALSSVVYTRKRYNVGEVNARSTGHIEQEGNTFY